MVSTIKCKVELTSFRIFIGSSSKVKPGNVSPSLKFHHIIVLCIVRPCLGGSTLIQKIELGLSSPIVYLYLARHLFNRGWRLLKQPKLILVTFHHHSSPIILIVLCPSLSSCAHIDPNHRIRIIISGCICSYALFS